MARSSVEVGYWSRASTTVELMWISYLLHEFNISVKDSVFLFCYNKSALQILQNPTHYENANHVHIDYHFAWHHVATGFLKPCYVESHL